MEAFVAANRDWIQKTLAAFAEEHPPEPFALPQRVELPGVGLAFRVCYEPKRGSKSVRYRTSGNLLVLRGRTNDGSLCIAALKRWLASVAKREFLPMLRALSKRTGEPFSRMHVRGQRTCWGSHSSNGTISLNYCLLFLQPEQVRYVMIHELCHARHMNHSRRYWALVARHEPGYRQLDDGLNSAWKQIPAWVGVY